MMVGPRQLFLTIVPFDLVLMSTLKEGDFQILVIPTENQ